MRRAIISDIHANLLALQAVLNDCASQKVDDLVCLGDICGYGPEPLECIDLVRTHVAWALCGNHDAALFMSVPIGFNRFAREAIEWQRSILQPRWYSLPKTVDRWHWLENLPASKIDGPVQYAHASPRDPLLDYVEEGDFLDMGFGPSAKAVETFDRIDHLAFCGHSHKPGAVTDEYVWTKPSGESFIYPLLEQRKTLVNVGSVGQPRDGNPLSCYVIYDTGAKSVEFRRVPYDIPAAQARFKQVPRLNERLWRRLETGT